MASAISNLIRSPCAVDIKGKRKQLGDLAPISTLLGIVEAARTCFENGCNKSQWNRDVHARLWSAALDNAAVNRNGILQDRSDVDVNLMHV
jgi:hypothetical protein